jgi:hypothetical protein
VTDDRRDADEIEALLRATTEAYIYRTRARLARCGGSTHFGATRIRQLLRQ